MSTDIRAFDSWLPQYVEAAYVKAQAITAGTALTIPTTRGLYINGSGNVTAFLVDSPATPVIFRDPPAGTILPVAAVQIGSATTVDIIALY